MLSDGPAAQPDGTAVPAGEQHQHWLRQNLNVGRRLGQSRPTRLPTMWHNAVLRVKLDRVDSVCSPSFGGIRHIRAGVSLKRMPGLVVRTVPASGCSYKVLGGPHILAERVGKHRLQPRPLRQELPPGAEANGELQFAVSSVARAHPIRSTASPTPRRADSVLRFPRV